LNHFYKSYRLRNLTFCRLGMSTSEELFLVEKVLGKRKSLKQLGGVEYRVKWLGFDTEYNTWEPATHLEACNDLVEQFERELSKKEVKKTRKKWRTDLATLDKNDEDSQCTEKDVNFNDVFINVDICETFEDGNNKINVSVANDNRNCRDDSKIKRQFKHFELSCESPFYPKDVKIKEEKKHPRTKRRGECFDVSPESPFCDKDIKKELNQSQVKNEEEYEEEFNKVPDIIVKQEYKSNTEFSPVKIIGVTKAPPLSELHFYVEFKSSFDSSTHRGLVPASEAYEDIPRMCLQFYENHIVWDVKIEDQENVVS